MPSIAVSRSYEAIYILDPDLGDDQVKTTSARYKQVVETAGGSVEKVDIWERRRLAYAVKGRTEGVYVVMQFQGVPTVEAELRRVFQISEDQIRYMIVKPEELDSPLPIDQAPVAEAAPEAPVAETEIVETPVAEAPVVEAPVVEAVVESEPAEPVAEAEVPEAVAAE